MHKHISEHPETQHLSDDVIHYREYKILLQPDRFTSKRGFMEFWEDVEKSAKKLDLKIDIDDKAFHSQVREVLFYDTPDFDLFNNHFILRKRTFYDEGWPRADHELTLKYRNPDLKTAAKVDVRPTRCVLISPKIELDRGIENIVAAFPALQHIDIRPRTKIELVNSMAVEEVQNFIGFIHFGHHYKGKTTIAVWRNRALEKSLSGEFAFQCKFDRLEEVRSSALELSEEFYKAVQLDCADWIKLGTTKTAMVYGLGNVPVKNHE